MNINVKEFIRNIIICLIALIIVSFILNYAPGYKRDKYVGTTNLIIDDENVTEYLTREIYLDQNNNAYMYIRDINSLFDKNIYYDSKYDVVVTSSKNSIGRIKIAEGKIDINGEIHDLECKVIKKNNEIYIPINELQSVYNITVNYIKDTNKVVVEKLNKGLIKAEVEETTTLKFKPRRLSKNVGEVEKGETVYCYYTTSKGWRLIRTDNGTLGYVKANVLSESRIVRQDTNDEIETKKIDINLNDGSKMTLYDENQNPRKIVIENIYGFDFGGQNIDTADITDYELWTTISNKGLEKQSNTLIKDYGSRLELINAIVNVTEKYNMKGINIDFQDVTDETAFYQFIIELAPRLRNKGITVNVILNDSFKEKNIVGIVDYLMTNKESN